MAVHLQSITRARAPSAFGALQDLHEFGHLPSLLGSITRGDRVLDAIGDVIAQNFFLSASQRSADCRNLRNDVDAIPILFDHARETAHLALDSVEPFKRRLLDVVAHHY